MKRIFYLILFTLILVGLTSCDSRNVDIQTIQVSIDKAKIYYPHFSEINGVTYHEARINISLEGTASQVNNVLLDLTYDDTIIGIIPDAEYGTGNDKVLRTDNNAIAKATIISRKAGTAVINVKVRKWSTNINKSIVVSLPEIVEFVASSESVIADSISFSLLSAKMMPPVSGKYIKFSSNVGFFDADSMSTNASGYAYTNIRSKESGLANVVAKISNYPTQQKTLSINFIEGKR